MDVPGASTTHESDSTSPKNSPVYRLRCGNVNKMDKRPRIYSKRVKPLKGALPIVSAAKRDINSTERKPMKREQRSHSARRTDMHKQDDVHVQKDHTSKNKYMKLSTKEVNVGHVSSLSNIKPTSDTVKVHIYKLQNDKNADMMSEMANKDILHEHGDEPSALHDACVKTCIHLIKSDIGIMHVVCEDCLRDFLSIQRGKCTQSTNN